MKADHQIQQRILLRVAWFLPVILVGCLDGDEQLNQAVRELRAEVQKAGEVNESLTSQLNEANSKIRELEKKPATAQEPQSKQTDAALAAELEAAKGRIAELERAVASADKSGKGGTLTAEGLRDLAKQLQTDLMVKVNQLSDQVQAKIPSANLQDVTVKRIHPPEELATAFSSAITLTFLDVGGQLVPLKFPVQAGLDGSWRVPTVEDVQKVFANAASGGGLAALQASTPAPAPTPTQAPAAPQPVAPSPSPGTGSSMGGGHPEIVIVWDPEAPAARPTAPAPNPTPTASVPAPPPVAPPQAPAVPQQSSVPAAVMPVQQDIIVRFD